MLKIKHKVYCIIGRTGSGKSSLAKQVAQVLGLDILKSYTTRPMRKEEINNPNVDHVFITEEQADKLLDNADVVAYTEINGYRYFATLEQLKSSDIYVIDPLGYESLVDTLKNWNVTYIELVPIYISAPKRVRMKRYLLRDNCTKEDFEKRDNAENAQFNNFEMKIIRHDDNRLGVTNTLSAHVIKNTSTFEEAVKQMKKIIKKL